MSQQRRQLAVEALPEPRCLFCGESFDPDEGRECPALDEGVCRP